MKISDPWFDLLTKKERDKLLNDLAEMARLRRLAYAAARDMVL